MCTVMRKKFISQITRVDVAAVAVVRLVVAAQFNESSFVKFKAHF